MRRRPTPILLVIVLTWAAACTTEGPSGSPTTVTPSGSASVPGTHRPEPPALDGRVFLSQSIVEHGAPRAMVGTSRIHLQFADGNLGVRGGCNGMDGPYALEGSTLVVGEMRSTAIGCGPELEEQDAWLRSVMSSRPTIVAEGNRLTIRSGETTIELLDVEVADPDRPLVGTTWRLETIIAGPTGTGGFATAEVPTLVLGDDGTVRFRDACQRGGGRYTIENDVVTFLSVIPDPDPNPNCAENDSTVDQAILRLLDGPAGFTIDGPVLKLMQGDHGIWWRAAP
jgi:heat shock protein HslJ